MRKKLYPYYWHIPAVALFFVFLLIPLIFGIVISFFKWNGMIEDLFKNFVKFENYTALLKDENFIIALKNTIFFTIGSVLLQNFLGFFIAVFIFFGRFRNSNIIRALIFCPGVLSGVLVALMWKQILASDGLINTILNFIGIQSIIFLTERNLVIWIMVLINAWQWTGFNMVIIYAGLLSLDTELIEASNLDGANFWQSIYHIVFPILKPIIWLSVIFNIIGGFRVFDVIWNATRGGPLNRSQVLSTYIFYRSFGDISMGYVNLGYASAIAVVLMLILIILTTLRMRYLRSGLR